MFIHTIIEAAESATSQVLKHSGAYRFDPIPELQKGAAAALSLMINAVLGKLDTLRVDALKDAPPPGRTPPGMGA
jgi:hypothetical protein